MAPTVRRRTRPSGDADVPPVRSPTRAAAPKRAAASGREAGKPALRRSIGRGATLALLLTAAAAALATTLPKWRAALDRAAVLGSLPTFPDGPDAGPAVMPARKFVEPTGGPVPADPANPTDAEVAAALGELGERALPRVPSGPSGYITVAELEAAGVSEDALRPRLRASVVGAFVADAATVGVHG